MEIKGGHVRFAEYPSANAKAWQTTHDGTDRT
jgi:hypothetical protein